MTRTVAILTGTSASGAACITKLLEAGGVTVRACTRSADKEAGLKSKFPGVETAVCDASDPASLRAALEGADAAFIVTPLDYAAGFAGDSEKAINMIRAAQEVGVKQIVHVGSHTAGDPEAMPTLAQRFYPTEQFLKNEVGDAMHWTVLRGGMFMQSIGHFIDEAKAKGGLRYPVGKLALVDVRDIGYCGAAILLHPEDAATHHGQFYEMTGPENLSMKEIAHTLETEVGVSMPVETISIEEFAKTAMPLVLEGMTVAAVGKGHVCEPELIEKITGKPANSLASYAREFREDLK